MQVRHILFDKGREIYAITADATLAEAIRLLAARHIGAVVVTGEDGSLVGILSERDVVRAVAEGQGQYLTRPVSAFMTRGITTCTEDDTVDGLMELMTMGRFRHIPVLAHGRLVGIVSIGDVVKSRIAETVAEAAVLRDYIATG